MKNLLKIIKTLVLLLCLGFCSLQSYFEIARYFKYQIFTASSVEDVEVAPINLVFCESVPIENQVKDWFIVGFIHPYNISRIFPIRKYPKNLHGLHHILQQITV